MDEQAAQLTGRELGGYRLLNLLGAGGGGVVYLAQRLDQPSALIALKLLDPSSFSDPRIRAILRARFTREAQAVQRLHHPHILPILDFGEQDGYLYMALPFMPGGDLAGRIGSFPRGMPLDEIAADLTQIASALDEAHRRHIIHRDIKPTNILLDAQGQLILADFGIARLLADEQAATPTTLTATGQVLGTPLYMAPEQVIGQPVGPAADIYALGVVLYQMVAGTPPFMADTPIAVAMKHVQEPPAPLRPQRPDLPAAAEAVILRAMAKRPADRFSSASALAQAFIAGLHSSNPAIPSTQLAQTPNPSSQATYGFAAKQSNAPTWAPSHPSSFANQQNESKRFSAGWAIAAAITLLAVVLAGIGYMGISNQAKGSSSDISNGVGQQNSSTSSSSGTTSSATTASATPWARSVVSSGALIYETHTAGSCDQQGATWASNGMAIQSCQSNALVMSAQECNCAIGVATLGTLPGVSYPSSYTAQVTANILGGASTAKFGFKFRQQSVQDQGQGRAGYSFLVDPNGQWQFNRYDADGTRHILVQQQLPSGITGVHTLDLTVSGTVYSLYIDGQLIAQEQEQTYLTGFLCLAIEPGATIGYSDFALFSSN